MSDSTTIAVLMPVIVLQIALQIYALYDLWKNWSANKSGWLWVGVIVLGSLLGPLVYFIVGRKGVEA